MYTLWLSIIYYLCISLMIIIRNTCTYIHNMHNIHIFIMFVHVLYNAFYWRHRHLIHLELMQWKKLTLTNTITIAVIAAERHIPSTSHWNTCAAVSFVLMVLWFESFEVPFPSVMWVGQKLPSMIQECKVMNIWYGWIQGIQ